MTVAELKAILADVHPDLEATCEVEINLDAANRSPNPATDFGEERAGVVSASVVEAGELVVLHPAQALIAE